MVKRILVILFFVGSMEAYGQSQSQMPAIDSLKFYGRTDSLAEKAKKLRFLVGAIATSIPDLKPGYERDFFDQFPSKFQDFVDLYGYVEMNDSDEDDHLNVLYEEYPRHVQLFNDIRTLPLEVYCAKLVDLCIGGYWQSDGVEMLRMGLEERVREYPNLICELLMKHTKSEIESFWSFYFDGPHPPKDVPEELRSISTINEEIYTLLNSALGKVQAKWKNWH